MLDDGSTDNTPEVVAAHTAAGHWDARTVTDLLPDLEMAPIFGLNLTTKNGRKRVRFGTIVFNGMVDTVDPATGRATGRDGRPS